MLYWYPIAIIDSSKTDATKAILGFVNIDIRIKNAGTGITYGENPVGKTTPIKANKSVKKAVIAIYFGCKKSFSKISYMIRTKMFRQIRLYKWLQVLSN